MIKFEADGVGRAIIPIDPKEIELDDGYGVATHGAIVATTESETALISKVIGRLTVKDPRSNKTKMFTQELKVIDILDKDGNPLFSSGEATQREINDALQNNPTTKWSVGKIELDFDYDDKWVLVPTLGYVMNAQVYSFKVINIGDVEFFLVSPETASTIIDRFYPSYTIEDWETQGLLDFLIELGYGIITSNIVTIKNEKYLGDMYHDVKYTSATLIASDRLFFIVATAVFTYNNINPQFIGKLVDKINISIRYSNLNLTPVTSYRDIFIDITDDSGLHEEERVDFVSTILKNINQFSVDMEPDNHITLRKEARVYHIETNDIAIYCGSRPNRPDTSASSEPQNNSFVCNIELPTKNERINSIYWSLINNIDVAIVAHPRFDGMVSTNKPENYKGIRVSEAGVKYHWMDGLYFFGIASDYKGVLVGEPMRLVPTLIFTDTKLSATKNVEFLKTVPEMETGSLSTHRINTQTNMPPIETGSARFYTISANGGGNGARGGYKYSSTGSIAKDLEVLASEAYKPSAASIGGITINGDILGIPAGTPIASVVKWFDLMHNKFSLGDNIKEIVMTTGDTVYKNGVFYATSNSYDLGYTLTIVEALGLSYNKEVRDYQNNLVLGDNGKTLYLSAGVHEGIVRDIARFWHNDVKDIIAYEEFILIDKQTSPLIAIKTNIFDRVKLQVLAVTLFSNANIYLKYDIEFRVGNVHNEDGLPFLLYTTLTEKELGNRDVYIIGDIVWNYQMWARGGTITSGIVTLDSVFWKIISNGEAVMHNYTYTFDAPQIYGTTEVTIQGVLPSSDEIFYNAPLNGITRSPVILQEEPPSTGVYLHIENVNISHKGEITAEIVYRDGKNNIVGTPPQAQYCNVEPNVLMEI